MQDFLKLFSFDPHKCGLHGVEREFHLLDRTGRYSPMAQSVLQGLGDEHTYAYELSACQLESRVGPTSLNNLAIELEYGEQRLRRKESLLGFTRSCKEVADESIPLDVFPDPYGRYERLTSQMPKEMLMAACQVIGTHIHTGMRDPETALMAYNTIIEHVDELLAIGDHSNGERIRLLTKLYPNIRPVPYKDMGAWHEEAVRLGYVNDPRRHWSWIRISIHGTIEVRTFGATENLTEIVQWAKIVHDILTPYI